MLSDKDLATFDREGYLVVEGVLAPALLEAALEECWEIAESLVRAEVTAGEVPSDLLDLPGPAQIIEMTRRTGKSYAQHFDIALPSGGTVRADTPINTGPNVFSIIVDDRLLDLRRGGRRAGDRVQPDRAPSGQTPSRGAADRS